MRQVRSVVAAQTIPLRGDVDANLATHARFIRAAADEEAKVIVFPELSLTGYELDLVPELAFTETDPRLSPLRELASTHDMTLIVGAPVRLGRRLHIGAFVVSPDGSLGLYAKRHPGAGEEAVIQAGDRSSIVRFHGHTGAVAICADANHAGHPEDAAAGGARTYLVSTFITPAELDRKTLALRTYAVRHRMAVVFANYGGASGGIESGGRSAVWSEQGELVAQLEGIGPGLAVGIETVTGWRGRAVDLQARSSTPARSPLTPAGQDNGDA